MIVKKGLLRKSMTLNLSKAREQEDAKSTIVINTNQSPVKKLANDGKIDFLKKQRQAVTHKILRFLMDFKNIIGVIAKSIERILFRYQ